MNTTARAVLITGCSSGIGLAVAHGLHERGYRVFATARRDEQVQTLKELGFDAYRLDLDDSQSIKTAVEAILSETEGKLYAVFNNGAYGQPGAVEDLSRDAVRQQFETNVYGWLELTNLLIPIMRRQGEGRIIQNSSILGFAAMAYRGAYNASKYAIEGFSDTLRLELRGSGVHVSLIEPGPITSKFRNNALQAFLDNIDYKNSVHSEHYQKVLQRLESTDSSTPFEQGPEQVLKRVIHALESKNPQIRYPVTFPTYLFAWLKRLLPDRLLDAIIAKIE